VSEIRPKSKVGLNLVEMVYMNLYSYNPTYCSS